MINLFFFFLDRKCILFILFVYFFVLGFVSLFVLKCVSLSALFKNSYRTDFQWKTLIQSTKYITIDYL